MSTGHKQETAIFTESLPDGSVIELIQVPDGSFKRGETQVHLPDFFLGKYPITNVQYLQFVEETQTNYPEWLEENSEYNIHKGTNQLYQAFVRDAQPVVGISWHNAVAYCKWLSKRSGKRYRLPSEAEWEYAARGGRKSLGFRYAGSNKLKEVGWYTLNSHEETKPVGLKLPNQLGLYDMSGNVYEWCADHWHKNYKGAPTDGSAWMEGGEKAQRVVRGGSWIDDDDVCSVSNRYWNDTDFRYDYFGFRLARY